MIQRARDWWNLWWPPRRRRAYELARIGLRLPAGSWSVRCGSWGFTRHGVILSVDGLKLRRTRMPFRAVFLAMELSGVITVELYRPGAWEGEFRKLCGKEAV